MSASSDDSSGEDPNVNFVIALVGETDGVLTTLGSGDSNP